jgi:hypothetical protein
MSKTIHNVVRYKTQNVMQRKMQWNAKREATQNAMQCNAMQCNAMQCNAMQNVMENAIRDTKR